jgi:hypothetical protein
MNNLYQYGGVTEQHVGYHGYTDTLGNSIQPSPYQADPDKGHKQAAEEVDLADSVSLITCRKSAVYLINYIYT